MANRVGGRTAYAIRLTTALGIFVEWATNE
jgi:hypothetical protein